MSPRPARPLHSVTLLPLAGCASTVGDEPDVVVDEDVVREEDVPKEDVTFPTFPDRGFPADVRPDVPMDVPVDVRLDVVLADVVTADFLVADWSTRANDRQCADPGVLGSHRAFRCPPGGTIATIWGTDIYTHDSSICTAALHAGRISLAASGVVTIQMAPARDSYLGTTRNGVTSSSYGPWGCSFQFP